jgi:hypothetical protein
LFLFPCFVCFVLFWFFLFETRLGQTKDYMHKMVFPASPLSTQH